MDFYIRPTEPKDAREITIIRRMPGVLENLASLPSEPFAQQEGVLASMDSNQHSFVAVGSEPQGERVVGNVFLMVSTQPRSRHCGWLGIMVHKDYQGQGIGTALLEAALDVADNWLKLVRLELTVYPDNSRAIALYRRYGFEVEGTQRLAAIRKGRYEDVLLMGRIQI